MNGTDVPHVATEFAEQAQLAFYDVFRKMGNLECSYMSYTFERDDGVRKHFFVDKVWLDIYMTEGFIKTCPLTIIGRQNNAILIPWNNLKSLDKNSRLTMDARLDMDIANGVTITRRIDNAKEMVSFATRKNNPKFLSILMKNNNYIKKQIIELRKIVIKANTFEDHFACAK